MIRTVGSLVGAVLFSIAYLTAPTNAWGRRIEVSMTVPSGAAPGEMFDVPIAIGAADRGVMSYALRIQYDPAVINVVGVHGGTFDGFAHDPVSNSAAFTSGTVDFTANNAGFLTTPSSFTVATVKFTTVGSTGQTTQVQLSVIPGNGLVNGRFKAVRPRFTTQAAQFTIR